VDRGPARSVEGETPVSCNCQDARAARAEAARQKARADALDARLGEMQRAVELLERRIGFGHQEGRRNVTEDLVGRSMPAPATGRRWWGER